MAEPRDCTRWAPLDAFPREAEFLSPEAQRRWLLGLMALGAMLRLTRYLLCFPLWEDEAMLSANLLDRGYAELLQPLRYCQVAPALFLWTQLFVVRLLGFHEYSLRLIPFLCGIGSLFLFRHVAGRLLQGVSLVLAVGLFAVAYPMTRYAAEAKPYGCDLFLALALLALAVEWLRRPDQVRWLWGLAALAGPAVGFSFPMVFIAGGLSAVLGCRLLSSCAPKAGGLRSPWLPWILFNAALIAAFAAVLWLSKYSVGASNQQTMEDTHWANTFPPIGQPLKLPRWLLETHAGAMLGYPVGGPNWGSAASLACVLAGLIVLARRRQWLLLGLLLGPLALNFIAAAMHRFPYGGHARMTLFLAPAFCMLIAFGLAAVLTSLDAWRTAWFQRPPDGMMKTGTGSATSHNVGLLEPLPVAVPVPVFTVNGMVVVLALLALLGAGSWVRDVAQPYKSGTTLRARQFAQWFWFQLAHDGELVSCETDLGLDLSPEKRNCGWSSLYLCNQRIYSPRHARRESPRLDRVAADWPLRCALYRAPLEERESPHPDPQARERWLEKMRADYDLVARDAYPFAAYDKSDRRKIADDYIEVFKFVPKGAVP